MLLYVWARQRRPHQPGLVLVQYNVAIPDAGIDNQAMNPAPELSRLWVACHVAVGVIQLLLQGSRMCRQHLLPLRLLHADVHDAAQETKSSAVAR